MSLTLHILKSPRLISEECVVLGATYRAIPSPRPNLPGLASPLSLIASHPVFLLPHSSMVCYSPQEAAQSEESFIFPVSSFQNSV